MSKLKLHQSSQQKLFENSIDNKDSTKTPLHFPTDFKLIQKRIAGINPVKYSRSRNFINGAVTYLSPYIARGVVSLTTVKDSVLEHFKFYEAEKLIQELAWREYFQRVWQHHQDAILSDVKQQQEDVKHHEIPLSLMNSITGINGIDDSIKTLYETGYMHNHSRMYTAMLTCNVAKSHWYAPSQWMYYHLLDGDIASNALSWQWVAGSFSSKKYFANQENINKYCHTNQQHTYLDTSYEELPTMPIPSTLAETTPFTLSTTLPSSKVLALDCTKPLFIYNNYNIDPLWHSEENGHRVFLLEPSHFQQFPVSAKVLQFVLDLAIHNIPSIQIFVGEYKDLIATWGGVVQQAFAKEHPTAKHYTCSIESRSWLFPEVTGYYPSFFAYWKKAERYIKKR
jgi:deoxyribodipyrimidine photo-lyase